MTGILSTGRYFISGFSKGRAALPACLGLAVALLLLAACSTNVPKGNLNSALAEPKVTLSPGDQVEVKFQFWLELNVTQLVLPVGNISLQFVGDVDVSGLTTAELDRKLTDLHLGPFKKPEISVIFQEPVNQRIFVCGKVNSPGICPSMAA